MDKIKADTIQIVVVAIVIMAMFISMAWAWAWRVVEGDRLNARARIGIECHVSSVDWIGNSYSFAVTCRLPSGE